jgi:hypothetical protein
MLNAHPGNSFQTARITKLFGCDADTRSYDLSERQTNLNCHDIFSTMSVHNLTLDFILSDTADVVMRY